MTSPTIEAAAALTLLDERERKAYAALNAAGTEQVGVVKHVVVLKLAALVARVPGFISVMMESEAESDDNGGMFMSIISSVLLDENVNNEARDRPGADLNPNTGLLDIDEAEDRIRELIDEYGTGLLEIWEDDTVSAAALPDLVASALAFAAAHPRTPAAADG